MSYEIMPFSHYAQLLDPEEVRTSHTTWQHATVPNSTQQLKTPCNQNCELPRRPSGIFLIKDCSSKSCVISTYTSDLSCDVVRGPSPGEPRFREVVAKDRAFFWLPATGYPQVWNSFTCDESWVLINAGVSIRGQISCIGDRYWLTEWTLSFLCWIFPMWWMLHVRLCCHSSGVLGLCWKLRAFGTAGPFCRDIT